MNHSRSLSFLSLHGICFTLLASCSSGAGLAQLRGAAAPAAGSPSGVAAQVLDEPASAARTPLAVAVALPAFRRGQLSTGLVVAYPETWFANETNGGATIVPPEAAAGQSIESYLAFAFAAPSITSPADVQVTETLRALVLQQFPALTTPLALTWETRALGAAGCWSARTAVQSTALAVELHFALRSGAVVALLGVGLPERINAHAPIAAAMLDGLVVAPPAGMNAAAPTAGYGAGPYYGAAQAGYGAAPVNYGAAAAQPAGALDPQLLGTWEWTDSYTNTQAGFSGGVSVRITFNADGTFQRSSSAGMGSNVGSGFSRGGESPGRWAVVNGMLQMYSADGNSETKYTFHDGALVFGTKGNYRFWYRR